MPDQTNQQSRVFKAYAESHKDELTAFNKAYRTLKKHGADLNVDLKPMKDIRYWVGKVLSPEQTVEKQPEPKHSPTERIKYEQE